MPNLLDYIDLNTGERNGILTSGGMGQLVGHRLKIDPADATQGIFFVPATGAAIKVEIVGRNKPADLMLMVPTGVVAGNYTLEVRATVNQSSDVRTGRLNATLTVS